MENNTINETRKKALEYLTKSNKHLFLDGTFHYKLELFEKDGKNYIAKLYFNGANGKILINTSEVISDAFFREHGSNSMNVFQKILFPNSVYKKIKSVPYFKKLKALVADIMKEITTDYNKNQELSLKYQNALIEIHQAYQDSVTKKLDVQ
jgi:hypothetical protein